jgi:hypothetical protein
MLLIAVDGGLSSGRQAAEAASGNRLLQHTTRLLQGLHEVLALPAGASASASGQQELAEDQAGLVLAALELLAVLLRDLSSQHAQPVLVAALPLLPAAFGGLLQLASLVAAAAPGGAAAAAASPALSLMWGSHAGRWRMDVCRSWAWTCRMLVPADWHGVSHHRAAYLAGLGAVEALLRLGPLLPQQPEMEPGSPDPTSGRPLVLPTGWVPPGSLMDGFDADPVQALVDESLVLVSTLVGSVCPLSAVAFRVDEEISLAAFHTAVTACKYEWATAAAVEDGIAEAIPSTASLGGTPATPASLETAAFVSAMLCCNTTAPGSNAVNNPRWVGVVHDWCLPASHWAGFTCPGCF